MNHKYYNEYIKKTKDWLESRFNWQDENGSYLSHQPIYQFELIHLDDYIRTFSIHTIIKSLKFENFVEIGGAEGYHSFLINNYRRASSITFDISAEANKRAHELFKISGVVGDAKHLPFKSNCFDLVLCSETLEHIYQPEIAIKELMRITKNYLLITTPAARTSSEKENYQVDLTKPHQHLTIFTLKEFQHFFHNNALYLGTGSQISLSFLLLFHSLTLNEKKDSFKGLNTGVYKNKIIRRLLRLGRKVLGEVSIAKFIIHLNFLLSKIFPEYTMNLLILYNKKNQFKEESKDLCVIKRNFIKFINKFNLQPYKGVLALPIIMAYLFIFFIKDFFSISTSNHSKYLKYDQKFLHNILTNYILNKNKTSLKLYKIKKNE